MKNFEVYRGLNKRYVTSNRLYVEKGENVKPCDENIKKTLKLVEDMINLAEKGDADREDNGYGIIYGVLRDSAYKIKIIAEAEKEKHINKGWWK